MTVIDDKRAEIARRPCSLLKIHVDTCTKLNPSIGEGDSSGAEPDECNATSKCAYTWFTCQDNASYTKGTRTFQFCNREAALPGCYPVLKKNTIRLPIKVNTEKFKTEVGELRFELDDFPLSGWDMVNPEKNIYGDGDYSLFETEGSSFWITWKARNQNYSMRLVEFYTGFTDIDLDDFELEFTGGLFDVQVNDKGARLLVRSFLWETANKEFPVQVSDSIVLAADINASATSLLLDDGTGSFDGTDLFDEATANRTRTLKIGDEYVIYDTMVAGAGGTTFSTLVRGAYGTTAASHSEGDKAEQVTVYSEDDADDWDDCTGILADICLIDLLLFYAKVPLDYMKVYDHSITITANVGAGDTTIPVSGVANLPEAGVIRINDEVIWYKAILGTSLINCVRGQGRTTAAAHTNGDDLYIFAVTEALGHWHPGLLFKARFESERPVSKRIETWRACAFANVWPGIDGKLDVSLQVPPITDFTVDYDDDDFIQGSKNWMDDDKTRKSRVQVWYNPREPDPKIITRDDDSGVNKLQDEYAGVFGYVDYEAENELVYDDVQIKTICAEWLYQQGDAKWLAEHAFTRTRYGIPTMDAALEIKDDDIQLMDLVRLTVKEDADAYGVLQQVFYIVVAKVKDGWSKLKLTFEQAGFAAAYNYATIGPENGVLDVGINDTIQTIDIDLSGTTLEFADWRTGDTHQVRIEDEEITYTTVTDQGSDVIRLTGVTRGVNGTSNVAHSIGTDVRMLYSAATDEHRRKHGWVGDATDNFVDSDGDFTDDTEGYMIW